MKGTTLLIFIIIALVLIMGCSRDDHSDIRIPSVSLSLLSEGPITIADPIDVALNIYHRKKDRVSFPEEDEAFFPFQLYDLIVKTSRVRGNQFKTMVIYTIRIFDTGEFTLAPLPVKVGEATLSTEKLVITVLSVLPKNDPNPALKDIRAPYRPKMRKIMFFIIPLSIIVAAAAAYFLRKLMGQKSGVSSELVFAENKIDPYEYSITELTLLKKEHEENTQETRSIYSKLSFVLRLFMGSMLEFNALKMTTGEIRRHLGNKGIMPLPSHRLMSILKRSDLVKFAKEKPQKEKIERDISESIEIVQKVHDMYSVKNEAVKADDV
jgi:hypothetical protein